MPVPSLTGSPDTEDVCPMPEQLWQMGVEVCFTTLNGIELRICRQSKSASSLKLSFNTGLSVLLFKEKCLTRAARSGQNLEQRRILRCCHFSQHLCYHSNLSDGKFATLYVFSFTGPTA